MPLLPVDTKHGPVRFHYVACAPSSVEIDLENLSLEEERPPRLDEGVPTLLFLHPVYIGMAIFERQFTSPVLRRFNLVAVDMLCHGDTEGDFPVPYPKEDIAEDVWRFIETARLPPLFVVGLSMGTIVALELALAYPESLVGVLQLSPLGAHEPPDVADGRKEIFDFWSEAIKLGDDSLRLDSIWGACQLGWNNQLDNTIQAIVDQTAPQCIRNWPVEKLDVLFEVTVKIIVENQAIDHGRLSKKIAIGIVRGTEDVAYSREYFDVYRQELGRPEEEIDFHEIEGGPHFFNIPYAAETNKIISDFVVKHDAKAGNLGAIPPSVKLISPFGLTIAPSSSGSEDEE